MRTILVVSAIGVTVWVLAAAGCSHRRGCRNGCFDGNCVPPAGSPPNYSAPLFGEPAGGATYGTPPAGSGVQPAPGTAPAPGGTTPMPVYEGSGTR